MTTTPVPAVGTPTNTPISVAGSVARTINVTFSPQFLALLSEHLYSSPNKAFEELVSNSWDANATCVYIKIPSDLADSKAAIWILDNGSSMDTSGFEQLWSIANSKKRDQDGTTGRKQIGKFGIGKLATYVLCNELTYICKAVDGVMRIITMDYRLIDDAKSKHLESLPLNVREIKDEKALQEALNNYEFGEDIFQLIKSDIPVVKNSDYDGTDFGGKEAAPLKVKDTWTLAILTTLKEEGKGIQEGWIKRLLSTALPLGSTIGINLNGATIAPSKSKVPVQKSWIIGPDLDFDELRLDDEKIVSIKKVSSPYPHILIDGLGEVTGKIILYEENIRGGKSDKISESNGFFINVRGRVINPGDNLFKLSDFNLSVLAQFRATIRIDNLDKQLAANRESIAESSELKIVRALLRKFFNLSRNEYRKIEEKKFNDASKGKKDEISGVPVAALNDLIHKNLEDGASLPPFVAVNEVDLPAEKQAWLDATKDDFSKSINLIEFGNDKPDDLHVKYDLKTRNIVINKNHPFVKENTRTAEQVNTLKDTTLVDLLTDAYIIKCGVSNDVYNDIVQHRDRVQRLVAQIRRNSASQIISALTNWIADVKPFEEIVGDALEYIGFSVERLGDSGEPEGVATGFITPQSDNKASVYSLTYDAKSTTHKKAKTGNVNIAGLARHREDHKADYSLVVAPDFQDGALEKEATNNRITPMRADTLAKLVSITIGFGPINLEKFKEIFALHSPDKVHKWVVALEKEISSQSSIDLKIFVSTLENLVTTNRIDVLSCDVIAQKYRELSGSTNGKPSRVDISQLCRGLSMIVPNAVFIDPNDDGFDVFILTHPSMLIKEIKRQTASIPDDLKVGSLK
jgi:hypothetical protein